MNICQVSVATLLLTTACGLRSPFTRDPRPSDDAGADGGASAPAGGSLPSDGGATARPFGAPSGAGGLGGSGLPVGGFASGVAGAAAASGTSPGTGAPGSGGGNGSSGLGSGGGDTDHPSGPGDGTAGGSSVASGGSGAPGVDAASSRPDAGGAADSGGGQAEPTTGDGGLATTIVFPDAGVITYPADPTIPSPLPSSPGAPAQPGARQPTASDDVTLYTTDGCGEPADCFLRASIVTLSGHAYGAGFSSSYPKDNCARDFTHDDNTVLIGDTFRTAPSLQCSAGGPSISVAFNIDYAIWYLSIGFDSVWSSDDGFRSEWQVANAAKPDNGSYYPLPGASSRLEFFWVQSSGRSYGQLQVPLLNNATGTRAVGYLEFDVVVR